MIDTEKIRTDLGQREYAAISREDLIVLLDIFEGYTYNLEAEAIETEERKLVLNELRLKAEAEAEAEAEKIRLEKLELVREGLHDFIEVTEDKNLDQIETFLKRLSDNQGIHPDIFSLRSLFDVAR